MYSRLSVGGLIVSIALCLGSLLLWGGVISITIHLGIPIFKNTSELERAQVMGAVVGVFHVHQRAAMVRGAHGMDFPPSIRVAVSDSSIDGEFPMAESRRFVSSA